MTNEKENKVWYACYGSNLLKERFQCYIEGGTPKNAKRTYPGCTDKNFSGISKPIRIPGELYFAKSSKTWSGGGAGFIRTETSNKEETLGRRYLISEKQFIELVQQEIKFDGEFHIDLEQVKQNGFLDMENGSWYGKIIYLAELEGCPVFTFTNEAYLEKEINAPHPFYLKIIIEGLKETYGMEETEIENYLISKKGIKGFPISEELKELISA
ncbi:hypothetical protein [Salegentibacter chungangensis]|uniref:Histone deacetylase n=1 Tax=Salegentibacter chungangensis TaxID=1335724 RepID=A0ABW3NPU0_9FLAO